MDSFKRIVKWVIISVAGLLLVTFLFLYFANYSKGYRAGVPIKVSSRGFVFKTYEGQLNIGGLTNSAEGVIPSTWEFSVQKSRKEVLDELDAAIQSGTRVKLFYEEKYFRFFWMGETKYYVYDVEEIN